MHKIEFTQDIKFGDKQITEINVKPLTFIELNTIWAAVGGNNTKPAVALQRSRILKQAHFMAGKDRVTPQLDQLNTLPSTVAKDIIASLDIGEGVAGEVVVSGDGSSKPIVYKLGTPFKMKTGGNTIAITELEFMATTYGQLEDVLAAESDMAKAVALIRDIAVPLGVDKLTTFPAWAMDRMTTADGVTIMRQVMPNF